MLLRTKTAWEAFEGEGEKGIGHFPVPRPITFKTRQSGFICMNKKNHSHIFVLAPRRKWGLGAQGPATAITPQGGRTPTGIPTRNPAM